MDKTFSKEERLGKDKLLKVVLSLAIPAFFAQFVAITYSIVDRIYIGNMKDVGESALAGVGICVPIVTLVLSFAEWVGFGGAPMLSIALGAKDKHRAEKILSQAFIFILIFSVIITVLFMSLYKPILYAFGATDAIFPYARDYYLYYISGTVFAMLTTGLNCFIVAQGFSKTAMGIVLSGAILNIILDPIFIFKLNLGVKGAAIASVISQIISTVICLLFLFSKKSIIQIKFNKFDFKIAVKILLIGLSPFIIIATDSILLIVLNKVISIHASEPKMVLAAMTITLSFYQVIIMPLGGLSTGSQPVLGYNYGAGDFKRVKKAQMLIVLICFAYTIIMFIVSRFCAVPFVKIFTKNRTIIPLAEKLIKTYTLGIMLLGIQYAFVDGLVGISEAGIAVILSMFRKLVLMLTLTIALPYKFGYIGALYAEPISDIASAILSTTVYFLVIGRIFKRRREKMALEQTAKQLEKNALNETK